MDSLTVLDVVVLVMDLPNEKLRKGSLGTVVEVFDNSDYLIEFANTDGETYALPVLSAAQLMKVYQQPVSA